jgi:hypothetical protein
MFDRLMYFVWTFAEAGLAVFGINGIYEQPPYTVRTDLGDGRDHRLPSRTAIWPRAERSTCCSLTSLGRIPAARPLR